MSANLAPQQDVKNPEISEEESVALSILLHNHIESLKVWQRKLKGPFLPTTGQHYRLTPHYPKPTIATTLQVLLAVKQAELEIVRFNLRVAERLKKERES